MFGKIGAIFTLAPKVVAVVKFVEDFVQAGGTEKKEIAQRILHNKLGIPDSYRDVTSNLIDTLVAAFNTLGLFSHSGGEDKDIIPPEKLRPDAQEARKVREEEDAELARFERNLAR